MSAPNLGIGMRERALRSVLGLALLVPAALGGIGLWGLVGTYPLMTGVLGLCPLGRLLGRTERAR